MRGINSGRTRGCNPAALSLDPGLLAQAIKIGNRATTRAAARNLAKLKKRNKPAAPDKGAL